MEAPRISSNMQASANARCYVEESHVHGHHAEQVHVNVVCRVVLVCARLQLRAVVQTAAE